MPSQLRIFFFQAEDGIRDGRVTGVQTCALPIFFVPARVHRRALPLSLQCMSSHPPHTCLHRRKCAQFHESPRSAAPALGRDRKSTRLNSSHPSISYAVFCLKKKIKKTRHVLLSV